MPHVDHQLTFKTEMTGHHHGQSDLRLVASLNGETVGRVDFVAEKFLVGLGLIPDVFEE